MAKQYFKLGELRDPNLPKTIREVIDQAETHPTMLHHDMWVFFTYAATPYKVMVTKSNKLVAVPPTIACEVPIGMFFNRTVARQILSVISEKLDPERYISNYAGSDMTDIYREYLNEYFKNKIDLNKVDFAKIEKELTDKLVKMLDRLYVPYEITHPKPVKTSSNWFRKLKWW